MTPRDAPIWILLGIFGALALGLALVPFRTWTVPPNLALVFLLYTIVVAELGGRGAGLVTAVVSALSLNFFLTPPYLTLTIDHPDNVIAFVALALSGLVAAAFGHRRTRSAELLSHARHDLEALESIARSLAAGGPLDDALEQVRRAVRLAGIAVRNADGRLIVAAPAAAAERPAPAAALDPDTLLGRHERYRLGRRGFRLPDGGGRLRLEAGSGPLWVDLWEDDRDGLTLDEYRALAVALVMLRLTLSPGVAPEAAGSPRVGAALP
jgi:hypothetical protein